MKYKDIRNSRILIYALGNGLAKENNNTLGQSQRRRFKEGLVFL